MEAQERESRVLKAEVFIRNPIRKRREDWITYKRSMKNYNVALKTRLTYGPYAVVYLDGPTLTLDKKKTKIFNQENVHSY